MKKNRIQSSLPAIAIALFPAVTFAQTPAVEPSAPPAPTPAAEAEKPAEPAPAVEVAAPEPPVTTPAVEAKPAEAKSAPAKEEKPPEQSLLPVKLSTHMLTRFEGRENYDKLGVSKGRFIEGDAVFYRARLGVQTNAIDLKDGIKALAQFTPQATGVWGSTGTTASPGVGIYEGYVKFFGEKASVEVGRFSMDYGDALVIGNLDWHQNGRAFDGLRTSLKLGKEKSFVDVFATQAARNGQDVAEGYPTQPGFLAGDNYFWGVYAGLGPLLKEKLDLDAYFLGVSNVETPNYVENDLTGTPVAPFTRSGTNEFTLGARIKDKIGMIDYRAEAGVQFGTRPLLAAPGQRDVLAYQADAELGFNFTKTIRLSLEGLIASGNDPKTTGTNEAWNALYATHHKFLGLMDVMGVRSNVISGVLHGSAGITDSLKLLVDAHVYKRPQLQPAAVPPAAGAPTQGGYEVNAGLLQKIGAPAHVRGLYGIFVPDVGYPSKEAAHYVELEGSFKF